MAIRRSILLAGALALGAAHCGGSSTPSSNTPHPPAGSSALPEDGSSSAESSDSTRALSDAQIATVTDKVNTAEIDQAQLAESTSSNDQVRRFARMMIEHHSEAKAKQAALGIGNADSSLSQQLEQQAQATLDTLKAKTGTEFDRAYMDAQVDAHQKALDTIRQQLLPNAQAQELRTYLQNLAPQVEQHLEQARTAQQGLSG